MLTCKSFPPSIVFCCLEPFLSRRNDIRLSFVVIFQLATKRLAKLLSHKPDWLASAASKQPRTI